MSDRAASLPPSYRELRSGLRTQLEVFLGEHRAAALALLDGLSEEEARARLVPSATTLLGLVKHLTLVETIWFAELMAGGSRHELGLPATPAESFVLAEDDTVASIAAGYDAACARSRGALEGRALDDVLMGHWLGDVTVQWVLLHCIRETAQHVGHGEILREQVLAARAGISAPPAS